jgi:hypothetical protein
MENVEGTLFARRGKLMLLHNNLLLLYLLWLMARFRS